MTELKPACKWRFRAPGSASSLGFFLLATLFFGTPVKSHETDAIKIDSKSDPYVPRKRDYSIETGGHWEKQTFGWVGGHVGFHVGRCFLISQDNCQHYIDLLGGVGIRNGKSASIGMLGLRWQLVNYPSPWAHFFRLLGGVSHTDIDNEIRDKPLFGVSYGFSRYLHKRFDAHAEIRVVHADQFFSQMTFGIQIKIDQWVEYFAGRLQALGEGTIEGTGKVLRATGELLTSPFEGKKSEQKESETKNPKK